MMKRKNSVTKMVALEAIIFVRFSPFNSCPVINDWPVSVMCMMKGIGFTSGNLRTGAKLATFIGNPPEVTKEEYIENLEVSGDGKWLATASTQVHLWEMEEENGLCVWNLQHQCGGHQSLLRKLTFSPDSRTLITVDDVLDPATSETYVMRLWDVASGRLKAQIELYTPVPIIEK